MYSSALFSKSVTFSVFVQCKHHSVAFNDFFQVSAEQEKQNVERFFPGGERVCVIDWPFTRHVLIPAPSSQAACQCSFCSFRKPPHKRNDGKEMAQEENFLPKYQRVKDLCQKAEYQTSCQQPGQVLDLHELRKIQEVNMLSAGCCFDICFTVHWKWPSLYSCGLICHILHGND